MKPTIVRHPPRAFTLIEIVLVLVVLAVAMAATAPSLRGWSQGAKLRDAGQQFLAATSYARSQAAALATPHRIAIDPVANTYAVQAMNGQAWEPVPGEWGQPTALPANYQMTWLGADPLNTAIDFFPNGRTTPGTARLTSQTGDVIEFTCLVPAEPFVKVETPR